MSSTLLQAVVFGLGTGVSPEPGLWVELTPATDGTWALKAIDQGGGDTTRESGGELLASATANTWARIGVGLNAAGTSAQLYVDGVAAGDPITTNLPITSDELGLVLGIRGAAGASGVILYVDRVIVAQETA